MIREIVIMFFYSKVTVQWLWTSTQFTIPTFPCKSQWPLPNTPIRVKSIIHLFFHKSTRAPTHSQAVHFQRSFCHMASTCDLLFSLQHTLCATSRDTWKIWNTIVASAVLCDHCSVEEMKESATWYIFCSTTECFGKSVRLEKKFWSLIPLSLYLN